jgi:hypothetical protein
MESRDPHAGLFGAILITRADLANDDATPKDVDRWAAAELGGHLPAAAHKNSLGAPRAPAFASRGGRCLLDPFAGAAVGPGDRDSRRPGRC